MTFEEQLKRAFDTLSERLHDEVARQVAAAVADAGRPLAESDTAPASAPLLEAIVIVDQAQSLRAVLDAAVAGAAKYADRVALLLVDGAGYRGWTFAGFDAAPEPSFSLHVANEHAGVIADAVRRGSAVSAVGTEQGPQFAALSPEDECLAVPLTLAREPVAVLYADHGRRPGWPAAIEIVARHASRSLEAIVATRAARFIAGSGAGSRAASDTWIQGEQASARRYARLLTSEIKLYHEAEVLAGRRSRDLALRLGGEIARARTLYEQRVPAHVRERGDFFRAELVRTLADGDESLLDLSS